MKRLLIILTVLALVGCDFESEEEKRARINKQTEEMFNNQSEWFKKSLQEVKDSIKFDLAPSYSVDSFDYPSEIKDSIPLPSAK